LGVLFFWFFCFFVCLGSPFCFALFFVFVVTLRPAKKKGTGTPKKRAKQKKKRSKEAKKKEEKNDCVDFAYRDYGHGLGVFILLLRPAHERGRDHSGGGREEETRREGRSEERAATKATTTKRTSGPCVVA
jgi:hypothetical protein